MGCLFRLPCFTLVGLFFLVIISCSGGDTGNDQIHVEEGLTYFMGRISSGGSHTCALTSGEGVLCWGKGTEGALGHGVDLSSDTPVKVLSLDGSTELSGIVQVSSGGSHTCALNSDGGVLCWGKGTNGALGDGKDSNSNMPVKVLALGEVPVEEVPGGGDEGEGEPTEEVTGGTGLSGVTQISSGMDHTCALLKSGGVLCWGEGGRDQLGYGDTQDSNVPVQVLAEGQALDGSPLSGVTQISLGGEHTCAVTSSEEVLCWGYGSGGRLGNDDNASAPSPVKVLFDSDGQGTMKPLGGVIQVSAGSEHTCAIVVGVIEEEPEEESEEEVVAAASDDSENGEVQRVFCWGSEANGRLGNNSSSGSSSVAVSVVFDKESDNVLVPLVGVTQVSVGGQHTCALTDGGEVLCWGAGANGRLGNVDSVDALTYVEVSGIGGDEDSKVLEVSLGEDHSCALRNNGSSICWGKGDSGQLGLGNDELTTNVPTEVVAILRNFSGVLGVSVGESHSCAWTEAEQAFCWGDGADGRLGNNGEVGLDIPTMVLSDGAGEPLSNVISMSLGSSHSCAVVGRIREEGMAFCWGEGTDGRLGLGSTQKKLLPKRVVAVGESSGGDPLMGVSEVSAGKDHTCALLGGEAGQGVVCWGKGTSGQLGHGLTTGSNTPVGVLAPGETASGGLLLTDVRQVLIGDSHSCALVDELEEGGNGELPGGRVLCWGDHTNGRLGDVDVTAASAFPLRVSNEQSTAWMYGATDLSVGASHSCAVQASATVSCWGNDGGDGRLGDAKGVWSAQPVVVLDVGGSADDDSSLGAITQVRSGEAHTCALNDNGAVFCWGTGTSGQLGNAGLVNALAPVQVVVDSEGSPLEAVTSLELGGSHSCAVQNGNILCWGDGTNGRLGNHQAVRAEIPVTVLSPLEPLNLGSTRSR